MTQPARIAVVHYHLRPGGVTNVIRNAVASLGPKAYRTVVLSGLPPALEVAAPVGVVDGLNYAGSKQAPRAGDLADRLAQAAEEALGGPPDLWHFHNHSIGKNPALTRVVGLFAARGDRLLLQIHDFPEDGRPGNYRELVIGAADGSRAQLGPALYPQGGHVHYATLNSRDRDFLVSSGAAPDRVHRLPNPVALDPARSREVPASGSRLFLYPTRAIRRKNLGEFLLWAALAPRGDRFAATLAPTSPSDKAAYDRWVALARRLKLPVQFEAGRDGAIPFAALLKSATAVMTTSIAEGFGLAFLEPWLVRRPVLGRDIPELTREFKDEGVQLPNLYAHVPVPLAWLDADALRRRIRTAYGTLLEAYGRKPTGDEAEAAVHAATSSEHVDFGRLDEETQAVVVRRARKTPEDFASLALPLPEPRSLPQQALSHNLRTIRDRYGLPAYAARLDAVYHAVLAGEARPADDLDAENLLSRFIAPERFNLLRT